MTRSEVGIHAGQPQQGYHALAEVRTRVTPATPFSRTPTDRDADHRLRALARDAGGNAVVDVRYDHRRSIRSSRTVTAIGIAVLLHADDAALGTGGPRDVH